jgi:hypothetical protein
MKKKSQHYEFLASAVLLGFVVTTNAIIIPISGVAIGTAAPPGTLGGFSMTPFGPDATPDGTVVSSAGPVTFNQAVTHDLIGVGWGTWGQGYAGSVYDTGSSVNATTLVLTFLSAVNAFDFYVESVNFANFTFTATSQDGTIISQVVNGNGGASGFGFYTSGADMISSITVTTTDSDGFAIGEFGVNGTSSVPETGSTLGYLGLSLMTLAACGFYFSRRDKVEVWKYWLAKNIVKSDKQK